MKAIWVTLFLAALGLAPPAFAAGADDCIECHAKTTEKTASGKSAKVDPEEFGGSVHAKGKRKCLACHEEVENPDKAPHGKVKPVDCASCHDKEAAEYATTIHGKAKAGGKTASATCVDCHGAHDIRKTDDPKSKVHKVNMDVTCGVCHGNEAMIKKEKMPGGNVAKLYHDSIHGESVHGKDKSKAPTCTDCHGAHDMRPKSDPESNVHKTKVVETCGTCHSKERKVFLTSKHGKLKAQNVNAAPGCTDCHGAHGVKKHDLPGWQVDVVKECGDCHLDYIKTFRDTYHGKVTDLGYTRVATCASCHGAHQILPKDDPESKVSDRNRLATCQSCHPKANANFVKFEPHANKSSLESGPALYYTTKFMQFLLAGVFSFFGLHTVLWLYRSIKVVSARRAARKTGEKS